MRALACSLLLLATSSSGCRLNIGDGRADPLDAQPDLASACPGEVSAGAACEVAGTRCTGVRGCYLCGGYPLYVVTTGDCTCTTNPITKEAQWQCSAPDDCAPDICNPPTLYGDAQCQQPLQCRDGGVGDPRG